MSSMSSDLQVHAKVGSRVGLHARPAALIAKAVAALDATVTLAKPGGAPVSAASPLMIVSLGATCGDEVLITADGPQAEQALADVRDLVERDLDANDG
jgi:phosphocarrier protein HPr